MEQCHDESQTLDLDSYTYTPTELNLMDVNHKKKFTIVPLSAKNDNVEKFGIELECEFIDATNRERKNIVDEIRGINDNQSFYCVSDGSLSDGVEIVSHPMTFNAIKRFDWNKILKFRGKVQSYNTSSCGIHVHINRDSMSALNQYKFVQFINNQSTFAFYLSQRKVRRINQWSSFKSMLGDELKRQLIYQYKQDLDNDRESLYKNVLIGDKYYATNLRHSKTIEIRIFRGTLNQRSFLKNIEFIKSVADWCKVSNTRNYLDFKSYWRFVLKSDKYSNLVNFCNDSESMQKAIQFPKMRIRDLNTI